MLTRMKTVFAVLCWTGFLSAQVAMAQNKTATTPALDGFIFDKGDGVNPWTTPETQKDPGLFRFAVVADRTGGLRTGVFEDAVRKLNLLKPEFVMCVGDLVTGYFEDEKGIEGQWNEFAGIVKNLEAPFFYLPGNHDYSNPVMARKWKERYGRSYYSFSYKSTLFLCVNTEAKGKDGKLDQAQIEYFKNAVAADKSAKWIMVFMHNPIWFKEDEARPSGWKDIQTALEGRNYTVISGHWHGYTKSVRDNQKHFILSTTGGGNNLNGEYFGEMDQLVWITMTEKGPVIANLLLDGVLDEDVVTEKSQKEMSSYLNAFGVTVSPLVITEAVISGRHNVRMKFKNDNDFPARIESRIAANAIVSLQPETMVFHLKPHTVQDAELTVEMRKPVAVEEMPPVTIEAKAFFTPPGFKKELSYKYYADLLADTEHSCAPAKAPVTVDGNLDEWQELPYQADIGGKVTWRENWTGPEDASFRFATAYDKDYLYVAVKLRDDELLVDRSENPWDQDAVAITLDARDETGRGKDLGLQHQFKTHLLFDLSPSEKGRMIWYRQDLLPKDCKAACVKTPSGFNAEIAVPIGYVNEMQKKPWASFRLNVMMNDVDSRGKSQVRWRPDFPSCDPDIGTFTRKFASGGPEGNK